MGESTLEAGDRELIRWQVEKLLNVWRFSSRAKRLEMKCPRCYLGVELERRERRLSGFDGEAYKGGFEWLVDRTESKLEALAALGMPGCECDVWWPNHDG